jgi:hypothetical protein
MSDAQLVAHALHLLKTKPHYVADARQGARLGNSIIGSIMNLTLKSPRQMTEAAVVEALQLLDAEKRRQQP